uniref:Galaxin-like repeats domain-containing protein n=1 Tax=Magallana gigas TaxID=29159 RepID=A0A8W8IDK9_MAGGI|nr:galaxin-like isoform X1 [Crassostrea gigas]
MELRAAWRVIFFYLFPYASGDDNPGSSQDNFSVCQNNMNDISIGCCAGITELNKSNTHICCGGSLHPRYVDGSIHKCCRDKIYNGRKSICCNGVYYPDKSPDHYGCCSTSAYIFTEEMCCSSKLHKFHHTSSCCGNETYDVREKYCFQNMLIISLWESKCGDKIYNTSEHMCCNKTLIPHKYSHRCCGSLSYDPSNNDCAGNQVVQKGHQWCPNHGAYDVTTHNCCEGHLLKKNGPFWRCCGNKTIDYDMESCCAGMNFNKRINKCCGSRIIKMEDTCCSNQKLDKTTQVCCVKTFLRREEIVQKSAPYHDKCCPTRGGGVSYDSVNFVCSYEYRVVNKSMLDPRCGRQKYDPMKDLCCNYKLFKHALKDGMSCCHPSASIYNPKTDVCCFGKRQKGKSCKMPRYRLRCPRRCKLKKMNLKRYCRGYLSKTGRFKIIRNMRRQLGSIKRSNSCRCLYARRIQKPSCIGKQCVSFKKLIGISVEKINTTTLYIERKKKLFIKRFCQHALSTKESIL